MDITDSLDRGIASLRAHQAYIDGLGTEFDPDSFLRSMAQATGTVVGCTYALAVRALPV